MKEPAHPSRVAIVGVGNVGATCALPGEQGGRNHEERIEKQRDGDLHGMDRAGDNGEGK